MRVAVTARILVNSHIKKGLERLRSLHFQLNLSTGGAFDSKAAIRVSIHYSLPAPMATEAGHSTIPHQRHPARHAAAEAAER